jgi:hypothetical protein
MYFFKYDGHPTINGYDEIAESIYLGLNKFKLLPYSDTL